DAEAPRLGRRRLGGRYADDMEAAPYTVGEAGEEHGGGMPRAEPDTHPVRDQLEHPCRGVHQTWIRHPRLAARVGTPFQRRKPPMPTYSSNVRPCLYGRCASSIGSRAPSMMSADPRPVPRPRKSMRPPR